MANPLSQLGPVLDLLGEKLSITRLAQGDLILSHSVYRQPVKVTFPRPAYRHQEA